MVIFCVENSHEMCQDILFVSFLYFFLSLSPFNFSNLIFGVIYIGLFGISSMSSPSLAVGRNSRIHANASRRFFRYFFLFSFSFFSFSVSFSPFFFFIRTFIRSFFFDSAKVTFTYITCSAKPTFSFLSPLLHIT